MTEEELENYRKKMRMTRCKSCIYFSKTTSNPYCSSVLFDSCLNEYRRRSDLLRNKRNGK